MDKGWIKDGWIKYRWIRDGWIDSQTDGLMDIVYGWVDTDTGSIGTQ